MSVRNSRNTARSRQTKRFEGTGYPAGRFPDRGAVYKADSAQSGMQYRSASIRTVSLPRRAGRRA